MSEGQLFPSLPTQLSDRPGRTKATAAWADDPPDWIVVLADAVDRLGVAEVARKLGYSKSVVSETLSNKYKGRVERMESAVRGAFLGATVDCPVLGELPRDRCMAIQRQPFATSNPHRVMLAKACPTCSECTTRKPGGAS